MRKLARAFTAILLGATVPSQVTAMDTQPNVGSMVALVEAYSDLRQRVGEAKRGARYLASPGAAGAASCPAGTDDHGDSWTRVEQALTIWFGAHLTFLQVPPQEADRRSDAARAKDMLWERYRAALAAARRPRIGEPRADRHNSDLCKEVGGAGPLRVSSD